MQTLRRYTTSRFTGINIYDNTNQQWTQYKPLMHSNFEIYRYYIYRYIYMVRECGIMCDRTRYRQRRHLCQEELEKECYEQEFQSYCKSNYKPIVYQRNGYLNPYASLFIPTTSGHSLDLHHHF